MHRHAAVRHVGYLPNLASPCTLRTLQTRSCCVAPPSNMCCSTHSRPAERPFNAACADAFMLRNFSSDSPLEGRSAFAVEMTEMR